MGRTTILQKITDDILTGGRRTTAANTRDVLNEMANTYMSVIHDTASNFTASNPILETKQIGVVSDSLLSSPQYKIGDGINHWNDLPYSSGGAGIPSLQQVTDTGATSNNDIDFIGETDTFYKVRIGNDGTGSGDGNGSVQVYDDDNNSTIEIRGTNGFKVHDNAYSGASLFEVIRDNGVDTDKVVINASKSELTQGTASKLLRLNSSKEIVSSSYDDSALLPETAATIAAINHGTSAKTTLVDADEVTGQDSENSFSLIRTTWLNAWVYIKSKADSVYTTTSAVATQITTALTNYVTLTGTQTLTNKTVKPRIVTVTQSATPTFNIDNGDIFQITGLAQAITSMTTNMTGTPYDGQILEFQITDNGTARAITWGSNFANMWPTTTVASTKATVLTEYSSTSGKHEFFGFI